MPVFPPTRMNVEVELTNRTWMMQGRRRWDDDRDMDVDVDMEVTALAAQEEEVNQAHSKHYTSYSRWYRPIAAANRDIGDICVAFALAWQGCLTIPLSVCKPLMLTSSPAQLSLHSIQHTTLSSAYLQLELLFCSASHAVLCIDMMNDRFAFVCWNTEELARKNRSSSYLTCQIQRIHKF